MDLDGKGKDRKALLLLSSAGVCPSLLSLDIKPEVLQPLGCVPVAPRCYWAFILRMEAAPSGLLILRLSAPKAELCYLLQLSNLWRTFRPIKPFILYDHVSQCPNKFYMCINMHKSCKKIKVKVYKKVDFSLQIDQHPKFLRNRRE